MVSAPLLGIVVVRGANPIWSRVGVTGDTGLRSSSSAKGTPAGPLLEIAFLKLWLRESALLEPADSAPGE